MKKYKVTEEIKDLFLECNAAAECRDSCINLLFRTRKAIYYAKKSLAANDKAWDLVFKLWPELKSKRIQYHRDISEVKIKI